MNTQLAGQVVVVVGGANGIGRAIVAAFEAEGCRVAIVDRVAATDFAGMSVIADVTDFDAIQRAAATIQSELDQCDHVVFAAGVGSGKVGFPFWNLDPADWDRVLRVNLIGAVNVAHAFAPEMAKAGAGTFLFLASVAGQTGSQTDPPYSASKAGLINFAQCAARDLAPFGVRVNTLNPGMVRTELGRSVYEASVANMLAESRPTFEDWASDKIRRVVPLGRWQDANDMAALAVFLASPLAKNITGQTINVDGGYVMHS